jgi:hypothetical protein
MQYWKTKEIVSINFKNKIRKVDSVVKKQYPKAEKGLDVTKKCMNELIENHGFEAAKTILGTSVCSDEIVRSTMNFRNYINNKNPFSLGGLGGFPFSGITGFGAFAAHIPDNGFAIIEYGPHIGVSKTGVIGNVQRVGQSLETTCCGALKVCVNDITEETAGSRDNDLDYQQWKLEEQLMDQKDRIKKSSEPLIEATEVMYQQIDSRIKKLLESTSASFKNKKVALIGGVIINTDFELPDWFDLREFTVKTF